MWKAIMLLAWCELNAGAQSPLLSTMLLMIWMATGNFPQLLVEPDLPHTGIIGVFQLLLRAKAGTSLRPSLPQTCYLPRTSFLLL